MESIRRSILDIIAARLKHDRIVVLTGARQKGKSTLCELLLPELLRLPFTCISFEDPDERIRFQRSAVSILESITAADGRSVER